MDVPNAGTRGPKGAVGMGCHASLSSREYIGRLRQQHSQDALTRSAIDLPCAIQSRYVIGFRHSHTCPGGVVLLKGRPHSRVICEGVIYSFRHRKLLRRGRGWLLRTDLRCQPQREIDSECGKQFCSADEHEFGNLQYCWFYRTNPTRH